MMMMMMAGPAAYTAATTYVAILPALPSSGLYPDSSPNDDEQRLRPAGSVQPEHDRGTICASEYYEGSNSVDGVLIFG